MTSRFTILATLSLMAAFIATPAHTRIEAQLQAQAPDSHAHAATAPAQGASAEQSKAMMATMMAADAKLGELVNKMNDLPGTAKTDAISEVVTALVEQHRAMHTMMMNMGMMSGVGGPGQNTPKK